MPPNANFRTSLTATRITHVPFNREGMYISSTERTTYKVGVYDALDVAMRRPPMGRPQASMEPVRAGQRHVDRSPRHILSFIDRFLIDLIDLIDYDLRNIEASREHDDCTDDDEGRCWDFCGSAWVCEVVAGTFERDQAGRCGGGEETGGDGAGWRRRYVWWKRGKTRTWFVWLRERIRVERGVERGVERARCVAAAPERAG